MNQCQFLVVEKYNENIYFIFGSRQYPQPLTLILPLFNDH